MTVKNGQNLAKTEYFPIKEFLSKIIIEPDTLEEAEYKNIMFEEYMEKLLQFSETSIAIFLAESLKKEWESSNKIENSKGTIEFGEDMFFNKLSISHNRVKELHKVVIGLDKKEDYWKKEVNVSTIEPYEEWMKENENNIITDTAQGKICEHIYWRGSEVKDIKKFMDDFLIYYKDSSISIINTNPFIKASLIHLIFVRIHPFLDGNGRTARVLHNIKFTDSINRIKNTKLKLCPVNISYCIEKFKTTYSKKIDDIYFDLDHFDNIYKNSEAINVWIRFNLRNYQDEIAYLMSRLDNKVVQEAMKNIETMSSNDEESIWSKEIKKMKIKNLYKQ